jgi:hypothetical protein
MRLQHHVQQVPALLRYPLALLLNDGRYLIPDLFVSDEEVVRVVTDHQGLPCDHAKEDGADAKYI